MAYVETSKDTLISRWNDEQCTFIKKTMFLMSVKIIFWVTEQEPKYCENVAHQKANLDKPYRWLIQFQIKND